MRRRWILKRLFTIPREAITTRKKNAELESKTNGSGMKIALNVWKVARTSS
jgi:hypothetical protein